MLSDVYFDAARMLEEGLFYFRFPQAQVFSYSEGHKARLKSLIEILSMESKFFDRLGIDGVLSKEKSRQDMERYNALLDGLKLKMS